MGKLTVWFNNTFLKKYNEDDDFVLFKKAQFISSLASALIVIMVMLLAVSLSTSMEVFLTAYKPALTLIVVLIITMTLVVKGRVLWSANFIAVMSLLIEIFAFTSRPPHLATVTIGLFFYQTLVFATLFCGTYLSIIILAAIISTHIYYFIAITSKTVQGPALDAGRMAAVDGSITLITVFLICLALSRFLIKAIEKANNQSKKNLEQYHDIRNMMETIHSTSELLGKSIIETSSEVTAISDSAQSQAAAVEELSATMEEISAGTVNVSFSSREQGDSIHNLVETLEKLSSLIEKLEINGIQGKAVDVLRAIHDQKLMNEDMNQKTRTVKNKTDQISTAMMEQEKAVENIVSSIADTTNAIQGIAGSIENLKINSEGLKNLAEDLDRRFARA